MTSRNGLNRSPKLLTGLKLVSVQLVPSCSQLAMWEVRSTYKKGCQVATLQNLIANCL